MNVLAPLATPTDGPTAAGRGARQRLGDLLVASGLISSEQLTEALRVQRADTVQHRRLGRVLVDLGYVDERVVTVRLAQQLGIPTVDLSSSSVPDDVVRRLPQRISERHGVCVVEVRADGHIVLAMADPTDVVAMDDIRLRLKAGVVPVAAMESQIRELVRKAWAMSADGSDLAALGVDMSESPSADARASAVASQVDDSPTVKLVDQILADAVAARASDIHLETQRDALRVRFRVDGLLRDALLGPPSLAGSVVGRIKIMSGLDISERRVPQDGRTRFTVDGAEIDARVSTLPSLHGEKVVIRILTRGDAVPGLGDLGFEPDQLAVFERALALPQGLILITGPTGSGKTNTLYAGIQAVLRPDKNLVTLEDPVEVQLAGITQVQINPKAGLTFEAGLRSVLRQDPDIVLVGEIRDTETAELALKAALTGHLVLTTLHTNSAVAAVTRLIDMGADPFLVASSLALVVAQRLVRRPCPDCVEPYRPSEETLALLGLDRRTVEHATPMQGRGCRECGGTGYRGRTGVYEVLEVDADMRKVLAKEPTEAAVATQAKSAGLQSLRASGLFKAMAGKTTFDEVLRVTATDRVAAQFCAACSKLLDPAMVRCPWCATAVADSRCRHCAKPLEGDWLACPWCLAADPVGAHPLPRQLPSPAAVDIPTADPPRRTGRHARVA